MAKQTGRTHPAWALAHKKSGTELRFINGKYYLYSYVTKYDKDKKGPRKVTGPILGSITEKDGFIPSAVRLIEKGNGPKKLTNIQVKEYGAASFLNSRFSLYSEALKKSFPEEWKEILAIAYCRFVYKCPLKSIPFRLASSYLTELLELGAWGPNKASGILKQIGFKREQMLNYMKSFIGQEDFILIDATNITSHSQKIDLAKKGYNSKFQFDSQFNLMYIFSHQSRMPIYYRLLAGNIREVRAFKNCLNESGLQKAIIVADKGFYSKANVELLGNEKLDFILPLKRNNPMIDYSAIADNTFKDGRYYFDHEKRAVWYRKFTREGNLCLHLFLDDFLRVKEEQDYLMRIKTHPEIYTIERYHLKKHQFGTIALLSEMPATSQEVYSYYKIRMDIEVLFDSMKNVLAADHTYMQDQQTLEGWMFINHITLQWYQHLYLELKDKGLIKKISVNDYIQLMTDVKKIRINGEWVSNEVTKQTSQLIAALGIQM